MAANKDQTDSQIKVGGKPKFTEAELKKKLTDMEYRVTQEKATEPPFTGKYDKHTEKGRYSCVVCGVALFYSKDKFDAGCGWPAFKEALTDAAVTFTTDESHGMERTEVTCTNCGAHLGHIFNDGPPPKRTRYCINSASLAFTAADKL